MKKASPITEIMRRDSPKYGRNSHRFMYQKNHAITEYPKVKIDSRKMPMKKWNKIQRLYHAGWKINWIAKKVGIEWHSVKIAVDDDYKKKRYELSKERMKRILADPIKRKAQFKKVDEWKKRMKESDSNYSKRYRRWLKHQNRVHTQKYDALHREERRIKAIKRYNGKKGIYGTKENLICLRENLSQ
jgi:hypothetical protein